MSIYILGPTPLKPLLRISPSRYSALCACALREIWAANGNAPLLPISTMARLGMIIHKLLELALSGQIPDENTMQGHWQEEVRRQEQEMKNNLLEKHLVPLAKHTNNYRVKQIMTYNMVRPLFREIVSYTSIAKKPVTELWVQTEDGKIGGKIDLVKYTDEGICIVDYKTGIIVDSDQHGGLIKEEYQKQLKIYGALYHLSHGIWPNRMVLIGLDQRQYEVAIDKDECKSLVASAISYLDNINARINTGMDADTFAVPSPENCRFCTYRPACKKYWIQKDGQNGWPTDFIGSIKEKKLLGNGSFKIELENEEERVTIRGLSPERYTFLNDGCSKMMFCNLRKDAILGYFRETPMTAGYGLSDEQ